ncbi:GNAT family N-acetyltransferase [Saccharopolyspora sp. HNM0983]|uniref:GNAT family N-acetyltransferase n=1 Tax=Saccharopolyspora montiporae TaxID=2781240 RepID=A0A929BAF7_9PSEU|nr:GNAT family N-acetyltransferase [Saccharopolyspora sp. HNM0983]MBE9375211.1 GNAT family N-acetyltransferase [Saccharopolyspora sp. HNM0983]
MQPALETSRLVIRDWTDSDADVRAAFTLYGRQEVTQWLTPAITHVTDLAEMREVLRRWLDEQASDLPPTGHWAMQRREDGAIVGGLVLRMLPPYDHDVELTWQLRPEAWGHGYATEGARALLAWAFGYEIDEVFALAMPANTRAIATAGRIGMEWVGETSKYYGTSLQVYRIRPGDLPGLPPLDATED